MIQITEVKIVETKNQDMVSVRSSIASIISSLLLVNQVSARHAFKHEAKEILPRQSDLDVALRPYNGPPGLTTSTWKQVLTFVTPSPGATPVAITTQSQVITSYVPQFTLCELPPVAEVLVTPIPTTTTAPYKNYTISIPPGNGTCTTIYSPTASTVCATVLTGLANKYTVSSCSQDITFSSNFGYALATATPTLTNISANGTASASLATITPPPTIQTLTTYYIAPWQQLTSAGPPTDVDLKICATYANGTTECVLEFFEWITRTVAKTTSTTTAINLTTTIQGPSQVIVETFVANITDYQTTFSLQTDMVMEYTTLVETTSTAIRSVGGVSTGPTVYRTLTVEQASPTLPKPTSTSTLRITRTVYVSGTTTVTLSSNGGLQTAAPGQTTLDVASVLGFGKE